MTYSGCFQKSMSCIKISSPAKNVFYKIMISVIFLQVMEVLALSGAVGERVGFPFPGVALGAF